MRSSNITLDEFFAGWEQSRQIFEALLDTVDAIGKVELRATKSQVGFYRRRAFAWAWIPDRYLRGNHAPLVITVSFRQRDSSSRWKEIVEPAPGRFTHHLELHSAAEVDAEVSAWLHEAWRAAG